MFYLHLRDKNQKPQKKTNEKDIFTYSYYWCMFVCIS